MPCCERNGAGALRQPASITPYTQCYLIPDSDIFFHVETHKVSASIGGGVHVSTLCFAFRNGQGNRIALFQPNTNPSVGNPKKKHRQPANKPVGAVIHDYLGERAIWSRKGYTWKDCPRDLTSLKPIRHLLHAEWPVPARGAWAIRPAAVNRCENSFDFN